MHRTVVFQTEFRAKKAMEDLNDYVEKIKHKIEEVCLRALKTLYMKIFKTQKIEKCRAPQKSSRGLCIYMTILESTCSILIRVV